MVAWQKFVFVIGFSVDCSVGFKASSGANAKISLNPADPRKLSAEQLQKIRELMPPEMFYYSDALFSFLGCPPGGDAGLLLPSSPPLYRRTNELQEERTTSPPL